jgi:Tol biopolymer transport system component
MRAKLLVIATVVMAAVLGTVVAAAGAPVSACPRAVRGLGMLAVVARRRVEVTDLATCRTLVVARVSVTSPVGRANSPVVHFLGDGHWLVYATTAENGSLRGPFVVPVTGGRARAPLGSGLVAFAWAPNGSRLYGITGGGELVSASPTGGRRVVAVGLGAATATTSQSLAISPDGRYAAVDISSCGAASSAELLSVDLRTGAVRTALRQTGEYYTLDGWSPDGRWLLYWAQSICSASLAADGFPLYAVVSGGGGRPVRAVAHVLLYPDFLTWCGARLIAAATPDRETEIDGKLVQSGPPAWRQRTIDGARSLSWVSPSCSASGRWLVAAAGANREIPFGAEHRSVYLLRPGGVVVRRLSQPGAAGLSDEAPRFSRDGRWVLYVRSRVVTVGTSAYSQDALELVRATGAGGAVPVLSFTSSDFSYYDHFKWPEEIDWYLPPVHAAHAVAAGRVVVAGRAYAGTVRRSGRRDINRGFGDPIDVDVSRGGTKATVIAVYQPCRRPPIEYPEPAFPAAKIVGDRFEATHEFVERSRSLYTRVSVAGMFVSGQRVEGRISSATNVSARTGRAGGVCRTSNDWQASEGPRGFRVCAPHPLGDFGVAQDIHDDRASCATVQRALKRGTFDPSTLPLAAAATFSTPDWSCHAIHVAARSWQCVRGGQRFQFTVWS